MQSVLVSSIFFCFAFLLGVWLAPVVRADYGEFKAYVEAKLKASAQAAKDKATSVISKL